MSGAESKKRAEEEREYYPALEPEIMKKELKEEQFAFRRRRAGSPAPSSLSLKSVRSIGEPPVFRNEPGPSDTKDPGINARHWRELNSMVSILDMFGFVKNELKRLKRLLTNDPEGLESQEALAAVGQRKPKSKPKNTIGCVFDGFARVMRSGPMFK